MDSMFSPPPRKSLSDEELSAAIGAPHSDEAGILAAMELLETQTKLRERDLRDRTDWEDSMLRLGSKEALRALDNARRVDDGLDPIPFEPEPVPEPVVVPEPVSEPVVLPEPVSEPVVLPEPVSEPVPEPIVVPEPVIAEVQSPDIAANLNALYGAPATTDFDELLAQTQVSDSTSFLPEDPTLGSAEEMASEFEEDHLIAPLVSPVPGLEKPEAANPEEVEKSLSAWSASTPWMVAFGGMASLSLALVAIATSTAGALNAVVGSCIGLLLAGCVLGVGAIAAKRGGAPMLLISRAAFGVATNFLPAIVITISRIVALVFILTAGVLVAFGFIGSWMPTESFAFTLSGFELAIPYSALLATVLVVPVLILGLLSSGARKVVTSTLGIANLVGSAAFIVFAATGAHDLGALVAEYSGFDLGTVVTLSGLTFALVLLLWAPFAADFTRPFKESSSNFRIFAVTWSLVSGIPIALVIGFTALVASRVEPNSVFNADYLGETLGFAGWQIVATGGALLVSIASISFLQATSIRDGLVSLNLRERRVWLVLILLVSAGLASWVGNRLGFAGFAYNVGGYLVALSIPVLAWVGIITSDVLLRRLNFHSVSLRRGYGFYRNLTWFNLTGWLVAMALGFGLERSQLQEFAWFGYLLAPFNLPVTLEPWHLGFWTAFLIAALFPVVFGVRHIRKQELEIGAIEARRLDLNSVHGITE